MRETNADVTCKGDHLRVMTQSVNLYDEWQPGTHRDLSLLSMFEESCRAESPFNIISSTARRHGTLAARNPPIVNRSSRLDMSKTIVWDWN
jgi:hypothetical protein